MSNSVDITIIGAGVIGLAIASEIAKKNREVFVLEKNKSFGLETSSHNSEVIHSGIYYPTGSLKAKTCVEGNQLLYRLCTEQKLAHKKIGKLIIANSVEESNELESLYIKGCANGAVDLEMLTSTEIKKLEPNIQAISALYSPSTGIIDSFSLMKYFESNAIDNQARIVYHTGVTGIKKINKGYMVTAGEHNDLHTFTTKIVINCAGLYSDRIAALAGIDISQAGYQLHYCRGEYYSVINSKKKLINNLIYPVPEAKNVGLGIHITVNLEGQIRLGPSSEYVEKIDYSIDDRNKNLFYSAVIRLLPGMEYDDIDPYMAGIRPKLQGPVDDFRDFVICEESKFGLPGFINLIGIESPGLTASPSIARLVGIMVDSLL